MAGGGNRSHPATPRRLQKARQSGDVPLSREATSAVVYGFSILSVWGVTAYILPDTMATLVALLRNSYDPRITPAVGIHIASRAVILLGLLTVGAASLGGVLGTLAQTRFLIRPGSLKWDLQRISPARGLKRLFGVDGLIELVRSILKVSLVALAGWFALASQIPDIASSFMRDMHFLPKMVQTLGFRLLLFAGIVQAVAAVADFAVVRLRFQFRHRMSREEIREEFKESEGNPQSKARIRRMQRSKRRRVTKAVQEATVVITNPTHFAVALAYDRSLGPAPRVVAKGVDFAAQRIRTWAKEAGVPIVENPPLARSLFRLEIDAEIAPEHYKTVAEIVAFVWRLKGQNNSVPGRSN